MPLLKKSQEPQGKSLDDSGTNAGLAQPSLPKAANEMVGRLGGTRKAGDKAAAPMTKDGYWERKEARDIETGIRIRRSGVWQAALQSVGVIQLNTSNTLEDFLVLVEKTANAGLAYVNKD